MNELGTLEGHTQLVCDLYFSRDGHQIISVSWDRTVRVWDGTLDRSIPRDREMASAAIRFFRSQSTDSQEVQRQVSQDRFLTERARQVAEAGVPIYAAWGCFDRVVPNDAAEGFTRATGAVVQWVPGGHSWMLARPSGMVDLLTHVPSGQQFVERIVSRWRVLEETPRLRRVD